MGSRLLIAAGEAATAPDQLRSGVRMLIDAADEAIEQADQRGLLDEVQERFAIPMTVFLLAGG